MSLAENMLQYLASGLTGAPHGRRRERKMSPIGLWSPVILGVLVSGCSLTPTVTKQTMTLGEVDMSNLVCRRDTPPDSNVPRTICASAESWAAFDSNRLRETDEILAEGRKHANVGAFNRN